MMKILPQVFIKKVSPQHILEDYAELMDLAGYRQFFSPTRKTLVKLNLSWSKYFPACSTPPWQLEGVLRKMRQDGFSGRKIFTCENRTVVTNITKGLEGNKWGALIAKYNTFFLPLNVIKYVPFKSQRPLLVLDSKIFPHGFTIPQFFLGKDMIHLPTFKTHGHTGAQGGEFGKDNPESNGGITGAIKNAFGGLLTKRRHFSHQYMGEVLHDLLVIQQQIHPHILAIADGTVAGDGAGPRCMIPRIKNYILAGYDQVAVDAIMAKMMGFDPLKLPFIRLCHDSGLGMGDPDQIEIIGDTEAKTENWHFHVSRSLIIWGDQQVRKGKLRFLEPLLHTFLFNIGPVQFSAFYHDILWYNTVGKRRIREYNHTAWGQLFESYPTTLDPLTKLNIIRPE